MNMRKKPGIPFEQYFPKADKGALRLLWRLLAFDPAERPTAGEPGWGGGKEGSGREAREGRGRQRNRGWEARQRLQRGTGNCAALGAGREEGEEIGTRLVGTLRGSEA